MIKGVLLDLYGTIFEYGDMGQAEADAGPVAFVQDVFTDGDVVLIHLEPEDTGCLVQVMEQFNLDFDDAYQYVAAERYNLSIVSFDSDFDRTELGRRTPAEILRDEDPAP